MLRWITSGESHGPSLVGVIEGLPAGIEINTQDIQDALARRRLGYGRGARMKFEQDKVRILAGLRHGKTQGGPLTIEIANTEWPKWEKVMSADPVKEEEIAGARNAPLTRPRPGHADLIGMRKYNFDDARPVLERASARETATRVALGTVAEHFLKQALGIELVSHVTAIGPVAIPTNAPQPKPSDTKKLDENPVRCLHPETAQKMIQEIDDCHKAGDTLGGIVEVIAYGVPSGIGTYTQGDRKLDAKLAQAIMGIQAIKGVEIGDGFTTATRRGSQAHDEIILDKNGNLTRTSNRAGGIEGGMSNGEPIIVKAAMKPISTVPRALATVDVSTKETAKAQHQRSDVCAVPPAAVVAQAMVALTIAELALEKFGGDSIEETRRNAKNYLQNIPENLT